MRRRGRLLFCWVGEVATSLFLAVNNPLKEVMFVKELCWERGFLFGRFSSALSAHWMPIECPLNTRPGSSALNAHWMPLSPLHWGWRWKGLRCVRCSALLNTWRFHKFSCDERFFLHVGSILRVTRCSSKLLLIYCVHIVYCLICFFHVCFGSWVTIISYHWAIAYLWSTKLWPILPALAEDWWVDGSDLQEHPGRHLARHVGICQEGCLK